MVHNPQSIYYLAPFRKKKLLTPVQTIVTYCCM